MPSFPTYLRLARLSNIPTVWTNVLAAGLLAGSQDMGQMAMLCLAGSLLYAGGCTLNDAFDAAWDRQHRPERPIPSGELSIREVSLAGSLEMLAGLALVVPFGWAATISALLLGFWILLYDWIHKKTAWAVLLMAACRLQLAYTAALAFRGPTWPNHLHAWALFAYIMIITVVARRESRPDGPYQRKFRVIGLLLALPACSVLLPLFCGGDVSVMPTMVLLALGLSTAWSLPAALLLAKQGSPAAGVFVRAALAGITLLDATFATLANEYLAMGLAALLPLCLLLQRKFAAT